MTHKFKNYFADMKQRDSPSFGIYDMMLLNSLLCNTFFLSVPTEEMIRKETADIYSYSENMVQTSCFCSDLFSKADYKTKSNETAL